MPTAPAADLLFDRHARRWLGPRVLALVGVLAACGSDDSPRTDTADGGDVTEHGDADAPPEAGADAESDTGAVGGDTTVGDAADVDDATELDTDVAEVVEGGSLEAVATCTLAAEACAESAPDPTIHASYRKDYWLPDELYQEYTDPPLDGGRMQIAGVAQASGAITDVVIDGVSVSERLAPPSPSLEWYHVWPDPAVAGEPIWVAFHSRDPAWDVAASGTVTVTTEEGVALDGAFPVTTTPGPITWVTEDDTGTHLLVHVRNDGTESLVVEEILVNAEPALDSGRACLAVPTIAPGDTALFRLPLCEAPRHGAARTVVVEYVDAAPAVAVGRVLRPHFVVEAWPRGSDCPVPTDDGGTESFHEHRQAGFDTQYLYWGGGPPQCPTTTADVVNALAPTLEDTFVLLGDDFLPRIGDGPSPITDTSRVAGFLTGDESDGQVYDDVGSPRPEAKASKARRLWALHPEITVYNGAMTSGHVGTFAGMTDVQGIDVYLAACAPHISVYYPTLRQPFDYLRNARNNHMPGPTWLYAQGLHSGWNWGSDDEVWHVQPDPQELLVQAWYVMAAGGKGLMWFQTTRSEALFAPERWQAIADANWTIRGVRRLLREGDPTGTARTDGPALVEAIRSPDAIVVPVVNQATIAKVDEPTCLAALFDPANPPHWIFDDVTVDVTVDVPADQAAVDVFELGLDGGVRDARTIVDADARTVTLRSVTLDNDVPVRLYVIAAVDGLREEVAAAAARRH